MKFLIQKVKGKVVHDFSSTLLESIRYQNWLNNSNDMRFKYLDTVIDRNGNPVCSFGFKPFHEKYVPVGSVEFVTAFLQHFYNLTPKPKNVPTILFKFAGRPIVNGNHMDFENVIGGKYYAKSNDKIKGYSAMLNTNEPGMLPLPAGEYQVSEVVDIDSEWRCFVYNNKLVGLQNYTGDFTIFPNVDEINKIIETYKCAAPIAYTLDVFVDNKGTFVMEVHDFFSCGLYGFSDHLIYPQMLYKWFWQYVQREMYNKNLNK